MLMTLVAFAGFVNTASAAFIFEIDTDGADDGVLTFNPNFSFGGDTTTASQSATSSAFGTSGGDSIFGGDGSALPDTYLYSYTPDSEPDNLVIPMGQDLGDGNLASGLGGGGGGLYSVYATWPFTSNVSGGLTTYNVTTAGDGFSVSIDQNGGGPGLGNVWVQLGDINYSAGAIAVEQTAGSNAFVSMRAYGLLFEPVGAPIPEPSSAFLLLLGAVPLVLVRHRRRRR